MGTVSLNELRYLLYTNAITFAPTAHTEQAMAPKVTHQMSNFSHDGYRQALLCSTTQALQGSKSLDQVN